MQKARSRLQRSAAVTPPSSAPRPTPAPTRLRRPQKSAPKVSFEGVKSRARFLPLFGVALVAYGGIFWLITRISPEQVRDWLFPGSFIPFHILLASGNFFFFTFVTLRKRWGVFAALGIQWLLFLKLQGFTLDLWAWGSAGLIGAGGYFLRTWWKNRV